MLGRKCGSSYIDANFKIWFRNAIKDDKYKVFDPTISTGRLTNTMEGGLLRDLVKRFDGYKRSFSNSSPDVKFALPQHNDKAKPMHVLGKVDQGLLTITQLVAQRNH